MAKLLLLTIFAVIQVLIAVAVPPKPTTLPPLHHAVTRSVKSKMFLKPSAHLGGTGSTKAYKKNQHIKDFALQGQISHLAGGMKYMNGMLIIPYDGVYFVYCQMNGYKNPASKPYGFAVMKNGIHLMRGILPGKYANNDDYIATVGGVFKLKAGDKIKIVHEGKTGSKYHMASTWSYFGAHLI